MNLNVFKYKNMFPSEVTEAGSFLLRIMGLLPPLHDTAVRLILKPLVCDDLVLPLLRTLENGGYLWKRKTGQGRFYAITAKTSAYLDMDEEHKKHRKQDIKDKALLTSKLKGSIAASAILSAGAAAYLDAWNRQPEEWRRGYLHGKKIDAQRFNAAIEARDQRTIDLLPRSIVSTAEVVRNMAKAVCHGEIPFTEPYTRAIYNAADDPIMKCSHIFDVGQATVIKLASQLYSARRTLSECPEIAGAVNRQFTRLSDAQEQVKEARRMSEVLTYSHGAKVLSQAQLDLNGIFIAELQQDTVTFGILNNATHGLHIDTLIARLDYCISLAEHLHRAPALIFYTLPGDRQATAQRLFAAAHQVRFVIPRFKWVEIPEKRPKQKWEIWRDFKRNAEKY